MTLKQKLDILKDVFEDVKCSWCGEDHPAILDLHHIDGRPDNLKSKPLAGLGKIKYREEAEKCLLLCSNCHRKLHYIERNYCSN